MPNQRTRARKKAEAQEAEAATAAAAAPPAAAEAAKPKEGGRQTGVCRWFVEKKKYGFISSGDGRDIFVHAMDVKDEIGEGDTVEYATVEFKGRPKAVDVVKVKSADPSRFPKEAANGKEADKDKLRAAAAEAFVAAEQEAAPAAAPPAPAPALAFPEGVPALTPLPGGAPPMPPPIDYPDAMPDVSRDPLVLDPSGLEAAVKAKLALEDAAHADGTITYHAELDQPLHPPVQHPDGTITVPDPAPAPDRQAAADVFAAPPPAPDLPPPPAPEFFGGLAPPAAPAASDPAAADLFGDPPAAADLFGDPPATVREVAGANRSWVLSQSGGSRLLARFYVRLAAPHSLIVLSSDPDTTRSPAGNTATLLT